MPRNRMRNDRTGGRSGSTTTQMARTVLIGSSIFVSGVMLYYLDQNLKQSRSLAAMSLLSLPTTLSSFQQQQSTTTTNLEYPRFARGELRPYCPGTTDYFDVRKLEITIGQARMFHTQGGNLKSVQTLMDNNIDATVQKLNAKFIPKGMKPEQGTQQVTQYLKSYYAQNYDPRGGYGKPLPGDYEPADHPLIAGGRYVQVVDPDNTRERWDYSLGPQDLPCQNLLRLGPRGADGTKWYCQPRNGMPNNKNVPSSLAVPPPLNTEDSTCHVISIGGNDNWNFELQVVTLLPGCVTHTFDCTLENGTPKQKPDREDIRFYNYCIDSVQRQDEHGRQYITYFDIVLKQAQLKVPPVLFKIDVEGFEYDVFSNMIQHAHNNYAVSTTAPLSSDVNLLHPPSYWLPQQIMVELHWATRMSGVSWMPRTRTTAEIALLSSMMYTGGGYMPVFRRWIKHCPSCIEVLYFRALC